jgi:hypothetical protein
MDLSHKQSLMRERMRPAKKETDEPQQKRRKIELFIRMKCDWYGCRQPGKQYTVKSTHPSLARVGTGQNDITYIGSTGVQRSYCDEHKVEAIERGFRVNFGIQ